MSLVFVDCEGNGIGAPGPAGGVMTEFGAVINPVVTFHGKDNSRKTFEDFCEWLRVNSKGCPVFVSDNPAYDWQWINYHMWEYFGDNPFGHSARRISDFYAGLTGDWGNTQKWKRLRVTPHDHNPVHDALGNYEAFHRLLNGER